MMESQNFRMVALKLHGLHPADRKWLLGHFTSPQQTVLRRLIKELNHLGLVSTEKLPAQLATFPVGAVSLDEAVVAVINQADVKTVKNVLNGLPDRFKAMVLYASSWQWSAALWISLEQQERERILRHANVCASIKPAVFNALVRSLADQIESMQPTTWSGRSSSLHGLSTIPGA